MKRGNNAVFTKEWYRGLTADSSFEDFQGYLYRTSPVGHSCAPPCWHREGWNPRAEANWSLNWLHRSWIWFSIPFLESFFLKGLDVFWAKEKFGWCFFDEWFFFLGWCFLIASLSPPLFHLQWGGPVLKKSGGLAARGVEPSFWVNMPSLFFPEVFPEVCWTFANRPRRNLGRKPGKLSHDKWWFHVPETHVALEICWLEDDEFQWFSLRHGPPW